MPSTTDDPIRRRPRAAVTWPAVVGLAAVASAAANVVIHAIADAADASMVVTAGDSTDEITAGVVIGASIVPVVAGLALVALLARRWPGVVRLAQVVGGAFALLSIASPLVADTDGGTSAALAVMHVTTGAAFVVGLEVARRRGAAGRSTGAASTADAPEGEPLAA